MIPFLFDILSVLPLSCIQPPGWRRWRSAYPSYALPMLRTAGAHSAGDTGTSHRVRASTRVSRSECSPRQRRPLVRIYGRSIKPSAARPLRGRYRVTRVHWHGATTGRMTRATCGSYGGMSPVVSEEMQAQETAPQHAPVEALAGLF